jgi:integrase
MDRIRSGRTEGAPLPRSEVEGQRGLGANDGTRHGAASETDAGGHRWAIRVPFRAWRTEVRRRGTGDLRQRRQGGGLRLKVHPHRLRHTFGFFLAEECADTRLIQDYLGHKDIKNSVIYTETSQRRLAAVRVR